MAALVPADLLGTALALMLSRRCIAISAMHAMLGQVMHMMPTAICRLARRLVKGN
jgi:hypothetical protein